MGKALWASTVSPLFALSTPCLLDVPSIHKANETRGVSIEEESWGTCCVVLPKDFCWHHYQIFR